MFFSFFRTQDLFCLSSLLPILFAQSWPHSLILKNTQFIYFPCLRQPRAFKDNDDLSTAILSCKEFARFAGTGSYRNVLLVLWRVRNLQETQTCENNYTIAWVVVASWVVRLISSFLSLSLLHTYKLDPIGSNENPGEVESELRICCFYSVVQFILS